MPRSKRGKNSFNPQLIGHPNPVAQQAILSKQMYSLKERIYLNPMIAHIKDPKEALASTIEQYFAPIGKMTKLKSFPAIGMFEAEITNEAGEVSKHSVNLSLLNHYSLKIAVTAYNEVAALKEQVTALTETVEGMMEEQMRDNRI